MAGKHGRDWTALRDEWVDRRMGGEMITLSAFARDKGIPRNTLSKRAIKDGWTAHAEEREAAVADRVAEVTEINHAAMRISMLQDHDLLRSFWRDQVKRWAKHLAEADNLTERVPMKDVVALGQLLLRLGETGAGLPKEHVVHHDGASEEVLTNRKQMRSLEGMVVQLAEHKRAKRQGRGKQ